MYLYSGEQLNESDSEREYFTSAEIYVSIAAGTALRKYKKQGESDMRPKEKSNWLSLGGKSHTASGHWRPAICKLMKEADVDRCLLNIYVDSALFQTVYIHLLRQTDIRPADNSLFFRKDCIAIYTTEQQTWLASNNAAEPVYLQFPRSELCKLWVSLLRSYAVPEIYGRWLSRPIIGRVDQGGSYRMWRELQLTVASGRNVGVSKFYDPSRCPDDIGQDAELRDIDVYCEIILNDVVCARTTLKKGLGLPEWHESFVFSDLPPFESLEIMIWKEKKVSKPSLLGRVIVDLVTFRRGEMIEAWYPVQSTNFSSQLQLGELRLKTQVNEDIILPHSSYSSLQQVLDTRNSLQWMQDLENTLHIKTLSHNLIKLAISQDSIIQQIQEAATWEIERAITSHQTLFRGNNVFTKTMEKCIGWYGNAFLEASIGSVIRKLLAEKIAIEVDPVRSGKPSKEVIKNVDLLIFWCNEIWGSIFSVKESCPRELCALLSTIRNLVEEHSRKADLAPEMQQQRPWQSVSAFIFLRFIVPGILHPHLSGLCPGLPDPALQRSLKLIAKVIQSMANLNIADQKEMAMVPIRDFIRNNTSRMKEYLKAVSTAKSALYSNQRLDDREGRHVLNNLARYKGTLPILGRESVSEPPHYIDPSRELAVIVSAVIRHSRDTSKRSRNHKLDNTALESLCAASFEVEAEALQRVNEFATKLAQERRRASASAAWTKHSTSLSESPPPSTIATSKPTLSPSSYVSSAVTSGPHPQSVIGTNDMFKWASLDPMSEALDEGAKRKKSFMRGFFGGL